MQYICDVIFCKLLFRINFFNYFDAKGCLKLYLLVQSFSGNISKNSFTRIGVDKALHAKKNKLEVIKLFRLPDNYLRSLNLLNSLPV